MSKKIFIFNDGTGQHLGSASLSNVAKLFLALPGTITTSSHADKYKVDTDKNYHAFYFRGIGTTDLRHKDESKEKYSGLKRFWEWLKNWFSDTARATGEMVSGTTIKDRVERTLLTIEENWKLGDQVFLIGFSRGAASIRIAASYLGQRDKNFKIDYMLIFDTVYSVLNEVQIRNDMPIKKFTDTEIGPYILKCDHLIAGDEMRDMFPVTPVNQRDGVRQILFAGSHSDVGGGNPKSSLSDISLTFAIEEFKSLDISFDSTALKQFNIAPDPTAPIEWDRFGGTGQTHYPRALEKLHFKVHKSVFTRANANKSVSIALSQLTHFETDSKDELIETSLIKAHFKNPHI